MKRLRIAALVSVTTGLLVLAVCWSQRRTGFATPAACLDAYREAILAGDLEHYWPCLAEPLCTQMKLQYPNPGDLATSLQKEMKEVRSWVQLPHAENGNSKVQVDVDEVRPDGNQRVQITLQRTATGWLIVAIDRPRVVPTGVPYGTHVSKASDEAPPAP